MTETGPIFLVEVTKGRLSANTYDEDFNLVMEHGTDINQGAYSRPTEVSYRKGDRLYLTQALIDGPFKGSVRKVMQPVEYIPVEKPVTREPPTSKKSDTNTNDESGDPSLGPETGNPGADEKPEKKLTAAEKRQKKAEEVAAAALAVKEEEENNKAGGKEATLADTIPPPE